MKLLLTNDDNEIIQEWSLDNESDQDAFLVLVDNAEIDDDQLAEQIYAAVDAALMKSQQARSKADPWT